VGVYNKLARDVTSVLMHLKINMLLWSSLLSCVVALFPRKLYVGCNRRVLHRKIIIFGCCLLCAPILDLTVFCVALRLFVLRYVCLRCFALLCVYLRLFAFICVLTCGIERILMIYLCIAYEIIYVISLKGRIRAPIPSKRCISFRKKCA